MRGAAAGVSDMQDEEEIEYLNESDVDLDEEDMEDLEGFEGGSSEEEGGSSEEAGTSGSDEGEWRA
jgi:hypothetical protein